MKRVLYADFRFHYKIYPGCSDSARTYRGPDVLFVSHELTLTGAPRMLFHAAQAVLSSGGFPVVVAPQDGPMRDEFVNAGITVIVDESVPHDHFLFGGFAKNFDVVVVNTVALIGVIRQLQEIEGLDIIWWVHEAKALQEVLVGRHDIEPKKLRLLAVSKYAAQYIPPAFDVNILYNGVPDKGRGTDGKGGSDKFTFVMLGTVEPRKGQDIFASAIMLLPEEVRARSSFKLGGKLWDMHVDFWAEIEKKTGMVKGFEYLGELSHADSVKCLSEADILVCCSRDDPFPLVVIEAAMLGKPAIISSDVGSAEVFEHGVSCFKFASEDAADLAAQMNRAFLDWENLKQMGSRARHEYDSHFTIQKFSENFLVHIVPGAHRPNFPIVDRERVVATLSS